MKLVTVASETVWKDATANVAKHEYHVSEVMKKWPDTELILFPELSLMGFLVDPSNAEIAEPLEGPSVTKMREVARKYAVAICFGIIESNAEGKPYNTQVVVSKSGEILAVYHKNHLFTESGEPDVYTPGESLVTFDLNGWKCGLSTCFDIRFPRLFEAYKNAGVELMLSGFNWVEGRNKPEIMKSLVKARAHENQYFFAAVDRSGKDPNTSFYGTHVTSSPYAENIANIDGVYAMAELEKSDIRTLPETLPLKSSFRNEYEVKSL